MKNYLFALVAVCCLLSSCHRAFATPPRPATATGPFTQKYDEFDKRNTVSSGDLACTPDIFDGGIFELRAEYPGRANAGNPDKLFITVIHSFSSYDTHWKSGLEYLLAGEKKVLKKTADVETIPRAPGELFRPSFFWRVPYEITGADLKALANESPIKWRLEKDRYECSGMALVRFRAFVARLSGPSRTTGLEVVIKESP